MALVEAEPLAQVAETQHDLTTGQLRAIAEYAKAHDLQPENVALEQVQKSTEGVTFWASKGLDVSARGPIGQSFQRALAHHSALKDMYKDLDEPLRRELLDSAFARCPFKDQLSKCPLKIHPPRSTSFSRDTIKDKPLHILFES